MYITELSIKRPVVAAVFSIILVVFGLFVFSKLPVRELPSGLQPPVVQVQVDYQGAGAEVIASEITEKAPTDSAGSTSSELTHNLVIFLLSVPKSSCSIIVSPLSTSLLWIVWEYVSFPIASVSVRLAIPYTSKLELFAVSLISSVLEGVIITANNTAKPIDVIWHDNLW